nr:immunoglobulin light chain junction region [Macaca mulatta]
CLQYNSIPFSF